MAPGKCRADDGERNGAKGLETRDATRTLRAGSGAHRGRRISRRRLAWKSEPANRGEWKRPRARLKQGEQDKSAVGRELGRDSVPVGCAPSPTVARRWCRPRVVP